MKLVAVLLCGLVAAAAARSTPGGLSPEETPQFILFSHDDAITSSTMSVLNSVVGGKSANGCPVAGTMFTLVDGTDWDNCRDLYEQGYEIAHHGVNHNSLRDMDEEEITYQLVEGRKQIAEGCGISEDEVVGHRSPYLQTKSEVKDVLKANGFTYDSSDIQSTRGNMGSRGWPSSMGGGMTQVALQDLSAKGGSFTMDYGDDPYGSGKTGGDVYGILMANFEESYNGNRAPFPLYLHTPHMQRNKAALESFVDEVSQRPGVYFVTMRQLLAWMDNPVPLSELSPSTLGCGNSGGSA